MACANFLITAKKGSSFRAPVKKKTEMPDFTCLGQRRQNFLSDVGMKDHLTAVSKVILIWSLQMVDAQSLILV